MTYLISGGRNTKQ